MRELKPLTSLRECGMPTTASRPADEGQETNRTLYFGDLAFYVTEEMLAERIREVCRVKSVKLILHPETQEQKATTFFDLVCFLEVVLLYPLLFLYRYLLLAPVPYSVVFSVDYF
jgi:hypothetical protein